MTIINLQQTSAFLMNYLLLQFVVLTLFALPIYFIIFMRITIIISLDYLILIFVNFIYFYFTFAIIINVIFTIILLEV